MKILKYLILGFLFVGLIACSGNEEKEDTETTTDEETAVVEEVKEEATEQLAEIGCALCQMGLDCESCQLAVKIEDKTYFVEGFEMDAEAEHELCSVIKKAKVKGQVAENRFKAENIEFIEE